MAMIVVVVKKKKIVAMIPKKMFTPSAQKV